MQHSTHTAVEPLHDAADIPNGIFTIQNPATGDYRTYKVRTSPKENQDGTPNNYFPGQRIVSVLIGRDNTWAGGKENWKDVGNVLPNGGLRIFNGLRGTNWEKLGKFCWKVLTLNAKSALPPVVELLCQNHCLRCNRALTRPSSILRNYGADCAEIMGYGPPPKVARKRKTKGVEAEVAV